MSAPKLPIQPTREQVFRFLFRSSDFGNLGLFVGAGFPKAVFSSDEENVALSWGDLLEECAKTMKVDLESCTGPGVSYPDVASRLCTKYAEASSTSFADALNLLKTTISSLTAWFPSAEQRQEYSGYLNSLAPAWIVTTNYDQVLECLLPGRSVSLGPQDAFMMRKGLIPIFHLHGVRTASEDLIIAQEDYVALFRPNAYRQIRLALAMKESTTCLVGYGLGDVNVLTALDWSRNVYADSLGVYPHEVIQVVRNKKPADEPYRSSSGIMVIETSSLADFFTEYKKVTKKLRRNRKEEKKQLRELAALFDNADPSDISKFLDDTDWRKSTFKVLSRFSAEVVVQFEGFFEKCLAEAKARSQPTGAFAAYATTLHLLLDFLTAFQCKDLPPSLVYVAVRSFDRLAPYVGRGFGQSWAAQDVWEARRVEIDEATLKELRIVAKQYGAASLRLLLKQSES